MRLPVLSFLILFVMFPVVLVNGTCCADNGSRRPGNNTAHNRTTNYACVLIFARLCISRITMLPIVFVNSTQCTDHSTGTTCNNTTHNRTTNYAGILVVCVFLFGEKRFFTQFCGSFSTIFYIRSRNNRSRTPTQKDGKE